MPPWHIASTPLVFFPQSRLASGNGPVKVVVQDDMLLKKMTLPSLVSPPPPSRAAGDRMKGAERNFRIVIRI